MSEPRSVQHVLDWIRGGAVRPGDQMLPPDVRRRNELARQFAACFRQYPDVLQAIFEATLFRPPVDHTLAPGPYQAYAQLRQGQNQVAAMIGHYLQLADEETSQNELPFDGPTAGWGDGPGDDGAAGSAWDGLAVR